MKILGIMSGTSLDGIDAALCEITGCGAGLRAKILAFECVPFDEELRARLFKACANQADVREVARLNVEVGEAFAQAANLVFQKHGRADLIGSHGQTLAHLPNEGVTLQIGEGAILAERCGVAVVCDFRPRDLAAGGQGAPLVPYVDWVLARSQTKNRVICNIGGIANVSILPANCELDAVRAWDCGPGNMLVDEAARRFLDLNCDPNGQFAELGKEDSRLVDEALKHPFFAKQPPKTAGREEFGAEFLDRFLEIASKLDEHEMENITGSVHDLLANLTRLTARSIAQSVRRFSGFVDDYELIIGGGGVHNQTLMRFVSQEIAPAQVLTHEKIGLDSDAKEALAFAILAHESWQGVSTNVAGVTGAVGARVLGKIVPL